MRDLRSLVVRSCAFYRHNHHHGGSGKVLKWSLLATVFFVLIQFAAGMQSG